MSDEANTQTTGKKFWYVAIERTIEIIERVEDVEVEAATEKEAMELALAKANSPRFRDWDECERRVLYEDVESAKTLED